MRLIGRNKNMIDYGHTCLLIFAQGIWKENYKNRFLKEIKSKFMASMNINENDLWGEYEQIPLFDPNSPEVNDKPCELCNPLAKVFLKKMGQNRGFILFSHNILGWKGMKDFLLYLLGDFNVKKIHYLELDQSSYLTSTKKRIPQIINNINEKKLNRTAFFDLFEKEKIEFSILYEIVKY